MHGKLAALILMIGLAGAAMLSLRHQRLTAVSQMTQAAKRIAEDDAALWRLRVEIARTITPARVREMSRTLGDLKPIEMDWCSPDPWCIPGPEGDPVPTPPRAPGAQVTHESVQPAGDEP